ncbi:poly-specific endoribonuclease-b-like [Plasmopara halstedii]|uniref:Poly-specific endoribonuclease-b-like n=1 Tax=Plasmopara halstedii TaxID=4781 RepID=A0A0P1ANP5_PLAHL|nr:poly-specific endoribonuclease-b-like [Plasmopara halstedii]CEG43062.1 poly-specific endoribonuclease-b-like [Plasmopara halstedii]|eukprot:XP_024579431.1 poly-specific endoribonuclease-b-like [Plasmopara halstedii]
MASTILPSAELKSLSAACNKLWELDTNRLEPNVHYELNLQEGKSAYARGDVAHEMLFTYVDPSIFERQTFKLLFDLLDNYERETGKSERVTPKELAENNAFLNAVIDTAPMRYAHAWLVKNRKFTGDMKDFKKKLELIWFGLYRRKTRNDSSGFEHVFVGEEKIGKICGCHNWLQVYNEERRGRIDYRGYIRPKQRGCKFLEPHNKEQLITFQFQWDNKIKLVSTSLIGVSPEFEMALYTICFLNGEENNHVQLGPYLVNIKCFAFGCGKDTKVGTAFPEALPLTEAQAAIKIQAILRGYHTRFHHPQIRRQARPPPPGAAWGPPPGVAAIAAPQPALAIENAWSKPLKPQASPPPPVATATGVWAQPHKW